MAPLRCFALLLALCAAAGADASKGRWETVIRMPGEEEPATARGEEAEDDAVGTRWAVLVAGSSGYGNYRHQVSGLVSAVRDRRGRCCSRLRMACCRCVRSSISLGNGMSVEESWLWKLGGLWKLSCESLCAILKIVDSVLIEIWDP
jgi:hypothetical protein